MTVHIIINGAKQLPYNRMSNEEDEENNNDITKKKKGQNDIRFKCDERKNRRDLQCGTYIYLLNYIRRGGLNFRVIIRIHFKGKSILRTYVNYHIGKKLF